MEHEFQYCVHCGTLNFLERKTCSLCKFRLPASSELTEPRKYKEWNYVFIGMILIALGLLFALASTLQPSKHLPSSTRDQNPYQSYYRGLK